MVIWIVGRSGCGKTTLAEGVLSLVREKLSNVVLLDGDAVRAIFANDLGYEIDDRKKNAGRLSQLSRFLEHQGIHVIAAVASAFEETREWNRANLTAYHEVLIECPFEQLVARDPKGLYKRALSGEIFLPGVNQPYEPPQCPDEVIVNSDSRDSLLTHAARLADLITLGHS